MNERAITPERARTIIEAILLTAEVPVSPGRLVDLLDGFNGRDIRQAIDALKEQYDRGEHGFTIAEVGGGFQLATRQDLAPWIRKFHRDRSQVRLSQAALETLAIVAFKQPLTRIEVDAIRGVNSGGVLHTLMENDMVRIVGRSDAIGKPMLFGTTREFLVHFGLKTLADLPKPKELEELLAEGEQKAQAREQLALELQDSTAEIEREEAPLAGEAGVDEVPGQTARSDAENDPVAEEGDPENADEASDQIVQWDAEAEQISEEGSSPSASEADEADEDDLAADASEADEADDLESDGADANEASEANDFEVGETDDLAADEADDLAADGADDLAAGEADETDDFESDGADDLEADEADDFEADEADTNEADTNEASEPNSTESDIAR